MKGCTSVRGEKTLLVTKHVKRIALKLRKAANYTL